MARFVASQSLSPFEVKPSLLLFCVSRGGADTRLAADRVPAHTSQYLAPSQSRVPIEEWLVQLKPFRISRELPPEARRNIGRMVQWHKPGEIRSRSIPSPLPNAVQRRVPNQRERARAPVAEENCTCRKAQSSIALIERRLRGRLPSGALSVHSEGRTPHYAAA